MMFPKLHFDGQIWRPPYEASSQLLQVTSGCTWHRCKFCSLYHGTPFRMSPFSEIEEDLQVIQEWQPRARRVYLTGAHPFALSYNKLMDIAVLLRKYLPEMVSFGILCGDCSFWVGFFYKISPIFINFAVSKTEQ